MKGERMRNMLLGMMVCIGCILVSGDFFTAAAFSLDEEQNASMVIVVRELAEPIEEENATVPFTVPLTVAEAPATELAGSVDGELDSTEIVPQYNVDDLHDSSMTQDACSINQPPVSETAIVLPPSTPSSVPEPSTWLLLGLGLLAGSRLLQAKKR